MKHLSCTRHASMMVLFAASVFAASVSGAWAQPPQALRSRRPPTQPVPHQTPPASPRDAIASIPIPANIPLRVKITQTVALKAGTPFRGQLMEPVYGTDRLLLPAGTTAAGVVSATPAADRRTRVNAKLDGDFTPLRVPVIRTSPLQLPLHRRFDSIRCSPARQSIESSLSSIQGQKGQNGALDAEGGTRAQPDRGRFAAPLVLGGLAAIAAGGDNDDIINHGVTSNGFGIPARILTTAAANNDASVAFAIFATAKSVYRRFIARGHEISFPANTELSISLSRR